MGRLGDKWNFIVTGPTGSERPLFTVHLKKLMKWIPASYRGRSVEYEIEGIMQVRVNHQVGLVFARALRAF